LEKFHYRANFALGVFESRNVTYKSMRKLAKPLPLETPTNIELAPGKSIRVTLIDANHCVGAVMFLIEGDGKAILYTGDIRAETWWVNSIVQNPTLAPYALGICQLDCIYLDTTFATTRNPYRTFPSKADGIKELLEKVGQYPDDTVFYFHSWTFGYENVWIALAAFLKSQIHLDEYRTRIYSSLSSLSKDCLRQAGLDAEQNNSTIQYRIGIREAPALCGFMNGNHVQPGCLTSLENVRIHSCERGMGCSVLDNDKDGNIVHIIPIISRTGHIEIAEPGAGGGKGDLAQKEELELTPNARKKLRELCHQSIKDPDLLSKVLQRLGRASVIDSDKVQLHKGKQESELDSTLQRLVSALTSNAFNESNDDIESLQHRTIRFPYSRHSSYSELCEFVAAFRPRDVFPCTVDEATWSPEVSMRQLFGHYCSSQTFRHDASMMPIFEARNSTQQTQGCKGSESHPNTQSAQSNTHFETPPASIVSSVPAPVAAYDDVGQPQVQRRPYVSPYAPILPAPLSGARRKQQEQPLSQSQLCKQFNSSRGNTVLGVVENVVTSLDSEVPQALPDAEVDKAEVGTTTVDTTAEKSVPDVALPELAIAAETRIEDVTDQPRVPPDAKVDEIQVEEEVIIDLAEEESAPDPAPVVLPDLAARAQSPIEEGPIPLAFKGPWQSPLEKADSRPRKKQRYKNSTLAYMAGKGTLLAGKGSLFTGEDSLLTWEDFGGLLSTRNDDARQEEIL
jgi:hypothetical protein